MTPTTRETRRADDAAAAAHDQAEARALEPSTGYQPLVLLAAAVTAGILADRMLAASLPFWCALVLLLWVGWWDLQHRGRSWHAAIVLLLASAALGAAWHHAHWRLFDEADIAWFAADETQPVCLEAVAVAAPTRMPAPRFDPLRALPSGESSRLELRVTDVRDGDRWLRSDGGATLIVAGHLQGVQAGDRLRVFGQLSGPAPVLNPGQFDFARYARGDRRMAIVRTNYLDAVTVVEPGSPWNVTNRIDAWRRRADALVWQTVGARRAGLESALLLGQRDQLSREQIESFVHTGTLDLLAISGMHVAMLAAALFLALRIALVPRRIGLLAVAMLTVFYALLTGAEPPVVRATVMVLVVCFGMALARQPATLNSLAAGALMVLALNPSNLFRAGPQLSFLAVCVLAWTMPRVARWPRLDPLERLIVETRPWPLRLVRQAWLWSARIVFVSTVIWLVMLPLILVRFHVVAPIGIALHPVLILPVAVSLLSGFALLVGGGIAAPVASWLGWVCDAGLWVIESLVRMGEKVPGGHFYAAGPHEWWMVGTYGLLAVWVLLAGRRPRGRWSLAIACAWIGLGFGAAAIDRPSDDQLRCTFLAVGHGTAVLIELPGGETLLYDAGRLGSPTGATRDVSGMLWERGISHLDGMVVSHADVDHYNGVPGLVERFSCGRVFAARPMIVEGSPAVETLWQALERQAIPVREVRAGDRLQNSSEAVLEVWHPPGAGVLGSDNANSIVLSIEFAGRRILLTGDLETPGLEAVLAELPYDCDVLLAPHHGSPRSDPPGFSAWATPEYVVISGGYGDEIRGVANTYEAAGARALHTAEVGAVEIIVDVTKVADQPGAMRVVTHRVERAP